MGLRIAYLSNFLPNKTGTGEDRLVALARAAGERGHSVTFFCHHPVHPPVAEALQRAGAHTAPLNPVGGRPLSSARRLARDFDVLQLNNIAPRSRIALATYLAWPAAVLFVDHVSGPPADQDSGLSLLSKFLDQVTMARVKQLAGVSDYVRDRDRARFGLPEHRVRTLYGGVDVQRFAPPDRERSATDEVEITVVSSLIPEKGIQVLLSAVAGFSDPHWHLNIVGEGPQKQALENMVHSLEISDQVSFLGLRDDVDQLLKDSHILAHPAIWSEALGYTVLEGMATGCAVVASRVGGIPELLEDGVHGRLVEPNRVEPLAQALAELRADPEQRKRLGVAARSRVVERFSLQRTIDELLDWCEWAGGMQSGPTRLVRQGG